MELEDCVATLVQRLRELKTPVYKDTVLSYAMKLLNKHEAHLNFAKVNAQQDYVRDEAGQLVWDMDKLNSWYYRRFLGDRSEFTTGAHALPVVSFSGPGFVFCFSKKDAHSHSLRHATSPQATNGSWTLPAQNGAPART